MGFETFPFVHQLEKVVFGRQFHAEPFTRDGLPWVAFVLNEIEEQRVEEMAERVGMPVVGENGEHNTFWGRHCGAGGMVWTDGRLQIEVMDDLGAEKVRNTLTSSIHFGFKETR